MATTLNKSIITIVAGNKTVIQTFNHYTSIQTSSSSNTTISASNAGITTLINNNPLIRTSTIGIKGINGTDGINGVDGTNGVTNEQIDISKVKLNPLAIGNDDIPSISLKEALEQFSTSGGDNSLDGGNATTVYGTTINYNGGGA